MLPVDDIFVPPVVITSFTWLCRDQCCCPRALVLVSRRLETGITRSWSWSWNGIMIFELCLIMFSLDQTVCWRSQCLLTNVHKWGHIGGYTIQFTLCIYLFTFSMSLQEATAQVQSCGSKSHQANSFGHCVCSAVSENFLYM